MLYANESAISDECISDFLSLLDNSIDLSGPLYTLSSNSNGTIKSATSFNSIGADPQWQNTKTALVFKSQNNEQVMSYLDPNLYSSQLQAQLVGNKIYFVNSVGQFSSIDLLSKQIVTINLPDVQVVQGYSPAHINDFFIYGNILYYLSGENCNEYRGVCNLTLHQYNLSSKQDKILTQGVSSPTIMGIDTDSNKLYLRQTFGDAGCVSQTIQEYDFATNKVTTTIKTGHCDGDPTNTPEDQKAKIIENQLRGQLDRLSEITVTNG